MSDQLSTIIGVVVDAVLGIAGTIISIILNSHYATRQEKLKQKASSIEGAFQTLIKVDDLFGSG